MMRKRLAAIVLTCCTICVFMAAGCGGKADAGTAGSCTPDGTASNAGGSENNGFGEGTGGSENSGFGEGAEGGTGETDFTGPDMSDAPAETLTLRIVDGAETGNLILAGEGAGEVYALSVGGMDILLDGEQASASVLEDGMLAEIRYTGGIDESFPAQIGSGSVESISVYSRGSGQNPLGEYYDLCGLYLQVLNDLWDVDSGLNGGAAYVSVDLSRAPGGLTEGEKAAVAWIFACAHDVEMLTLTYTELAEQGYLSEYGDFADNEPKFYEWRDGVLFSITEVENETEEFYSLPVLRFDAQKWRSPLGAYFYGDCKAVWSESGSWGSYSVGSEAIS